MYNYEVTSPEKNYTKISNFDSVVCFQWGTFCETMSRPKSFPFQLITLGVNEWHFGLPQFWAVIKIMRILYTMCALTKLNGVYCSQLWQSEMEFIHILLKLKGEIWGLDIASQNVPYRKQITEPKFLILVSVFFFSGEDILHPLIPVIVSTYNWKNAIPFCMGHPVLLLFYCQLYYLSSNVSVFSSVWSIISCRIVNTV